MKTRRKRAIPEGWATNDDISSYTQKSTSEPLYPGARFLAVDESGDQVLLGGSDGIAGIYSVSQGQIIRTLKGGSGSITCGILAGTKVIVSTSTGSVKIFDAQNEVASFKAHSGNVTDLALHPSGEIFASVSDDKSYVLYDLESPRVLSQVFSNSGQCARCVARAKLTNTEILCTQFHPDGHLLTTGGVDGQIKFYDVKSGSIGGTFDTGSPLKALFYSENGTWVAAANQGSTTVTIWDLRKAGTSNDPIKTIETGGIVESLNWDYTAQYLLVGGPSGISVEQYSKSSKAWSEPLKLAVPTHATAWGPSARSIFTIGTDGSLATFS